MNSEVYLHLVVRRVIALHYLNYIFEGPMGKRKANAAGLDEPDSSERDSTLSNVVYVG